MNGSFRETWEYLVDDIWMELEALSGPKSVAPGSLYSDLFATVDEFLSPLPTDAEREESRSDPAKARARFLSLRGIDFSSEAAVVYFLEQVFDLVEGYEVVGLSELYRRLIRGVIKKFNLRYRLDEPFVLRFLLPGSFSNLYSELHRLNLGNPHLTGLLNDFEKSFDSYARDQDPTDLKTCIAKASNYAEGVASATRGSAGTLGALCDQLTDWPHDKVRDSLKNLYKFCSDYPGIRHAGDPNGVRRDLGTRDVILTSLLILGFTGYLSPQVDAQITLGA